MGVGINDHGLSITQVRGDDKRFAVFIGSIRLNFFGLVFSLTSEFIGFIGLFAFTASIELIA